MEWIPIKTRPITEAEKKHYKDIGWDDVGFMYDCPLPEDGQEVLVTDRCGHVEVDTFVNDDGCYFECNCSEGDVTAWMPLPDAYSPEKRCAVCVETGTKWCSDCTENGGRYNYFKVR